MDVHTHQSGSRSQVTPTKSVKLAVLRDTVRHTKSQFDGRITDKTFPRPVDRYDGQNSLILGCEDCGNMWEPHDVQEAMDWVTDGYCPSCSGPTVVFAYEEAERCRGCGELGFYEDILENCCSRKCMLQWQYAKQLYERAADF